MANGISLEGVERLHSERIVLPPRSTLVIDSKFTLTNGTLNRLGGVIVTYPKETPAIHPRIASEAMFYSPNTQRWSDEERKRIQRIIVALSRTRPVLYLGRDHRIIQRAKISGTRHLDVSSANPADLVVHHQAELRDILFSLREDAKRNETGT
jgi:hypothetical protein